MAVGGHRLGIDFGTSSTVAVLAGPDGRERQLLFGETPVMPSAVYLDPDGVLLVGADALRSSRARPEHFEPNPKARIDDGILLLGDEEIPIVDVIAAVLRRVHDEAVRIAGGPISSSVLSHPAVWGIHRRGILQRAADSAGLPDASLVAEPVAAAAYFVKTLGNAVPVDSCIVIYDLGAGTFDASVVRRTPEGYTVLAEQGIPDAGGLDLDAAIFAYLGTVHAGSDWDRLAHPRTTADRRASRLLWDDVRNGKEALSRASNTTIFIPLLDTDAVLGREQLERLARPLLDRTVIATEATIRAAGVTPSAVFLVGGASRMPLVATLLHRALGFPPTAIEQPQLVVAGGSLRVPETQHGTVLLPAQPDDPLSASGFPVSAPPGTNWPVSASPISPAAAPLFTIPAAWPPTSEPPAAAPPEDPSDTPRPTADPIPGVPAEPPSADPQPSAGRRTPGDRVSGTPVWSATGPDDPPRPVASPPHSPPPGLPAPAAPGSVPSSASVSSSASLPSSAQVPSAVPVSPAAVGRVSMGPASPPPASSPPASSPLASPPIRRPAPPADDAPRLVGRRRLLQVAAGVAGVAVIGGVVYAAKAMGDSGNSGTGDGSTPNDGDTTTGDSTTTDSNTTSGDTNTSGDTSTPDAGTTPTDQTTPDITST